MMLSNGHTQILGLIGTQITKSHSYALHSAAIEHFGFNAVYLPFQSTQHNWNSIFGLDGFLGANVTMPYKETLLSEMDLLTDRAKRIGAINTIHKQNGLLIGDNTDAVGFLSSLEHQNIEWTLRPIYLLGAGGAAKAICDALSSLGIQQIHVWNRNSDRIESLRSLIGDIYIWNLAAPLPENAIIIQCTPLGQNGEDPLAEVSLLSSHLILDLIYKPTPLVQRVKSMGGIAIDGMGMLIHQAAYSFTRWFDCQPPINAMSTAIFNLQNTENTL